MTTATLTSKGQTTVPKEIRDHLGITAGDKLDFHIETDGRVVVRAATRSIRELKGLLHQSGRAPITLAEMDRAIAEGAARGRSR